MIFIVLSSLETVRDTAQYSTGTVFFSLLCRLLRIELKRQNPLLLYVRERERERERERLCTVNVQCSVQCPLLLRYLMLVMSYCG